MKKIRILHVIGSNPIGGIGTILLNLDRQYNRNEFEISYIYAKTNSNSTFQDEVLKNGSKVYVMPSFYGLGLFMYIFRVLLFYVKRATNYDIIHVHSLNTGILDLLLAKIFGVKLRISHSHSTCYSTNIFKSIRNYIPHLLSVHLSNAFIACSIDAGKFAFPKRSQSKIFYLNNAIDTSVFRYCPNSRISLRNTLNLGDDLVFVHLGSFTKEKNYKFIIDFFAEFLKNYERSQLLLVGAGGESDIVMEYVKLKDVKSKVQFLGRRQDVSRILSASDILIFPSLFEGLPLSVIEAQSTGLQCIISTNITEEVALANFVYRLDLADGAKQWARTVFKLKDNIVDRTTAFKLIELKGYCVKNQAESLSAYYKLKIL